MKNLRVFNLNGFFLSLVSLNKVEKVVNCSISFFLTIINLKIISRKLLSLSNLFRAQVFDINKMVKIIVSIK